MGGKRATKAEWDRYYDRAAQVRAVVGDPFERHIRRETVRERVFMIGSSLFVLVMVSVFYLLTTR
ncbi:MAG TPA: hypothetical protein VH853_15565 [Polyangia bacterium]|nr:hypothetical protein [Polyangia bacterium]